MKPKDVTQKTLKQSRRKPNSKATVNKGRKKIKVETLYRRMKAVDVADSAKDKGDMAKALGFLHSVLPTF